MISSGPSLRHWSGHRDLPINVFCLYYFLLSSLLYTSFCRYDLRHCSGVMDKKGSLQVLARPLGKNSFIVLYMLFYVSINWRSQNFYQQQKQQIFCSSIHQYFIFSKYQGTIQNNVFYVLITCLPKDNEPQLQRVLSSQAFLRTKYQPWICLKKRKQI